MSAFHIDAMGFVKSNNMLPLNTRKVRTSSVNNQHLMAMDEDLKPEGEGSFKNGPNYLVDTPSQNDLGSSNLTNDKKKTVKKAKTPA